MAAWVLSLLPAGPAGAALTADLSKGVLRVTQLSHGGAVLVQVLANQTVGLSENMGVPTFLSPVSEIEVTMLDGSGSALEVGFLAPLAGSLSLWLGNGARTVALAGEPEVGGDLSIWGGAGAQTVYDDASQPITCGGDLVLDGVNQFSTSGVPLVVGGDVEVSMDGETAPALFDTFYLDVAGDFSYRGSSEVDQVDIGFGYIDIRGKVRIELGDGITGSGDMQFVKLKTSGGNDHRIEGKMSVSAGASTNGDLVEVEENVELVGGLKLSLGEGMNTAILRGRGGKIQYTGGSSDDTVTLGASGPSAKLKLGAASDIVFLTNTLDLGKLAVDFGAANDELYIGLGTNVPAGAKFKNLP